MILFNKNKISDMFKQNYKFSKTKNCIIFSHVNVMIFQTRRSSCFNCLASKRARLNNVGSVSKPGNRGLASHLYTSNSPRQMHSKQSTDNWLICHRKSRSSRTGPRNFAVNRAELGLHLLSR